MDRELKEGIKREILTELHRAWSKGTIISLFPLQEARGWDEKHFWTALDELEHREYLIKEYGSSCTYEIRPSGILHAEKGDLVPAEEAGRQEEARTKLLAALAEDYEAHGSDSDVTPNELNLEGVDSDTAYQNLQLLEELGYAKGASMGYQITSHGLRAVNDWRRRHASLEAFEDVSKMMPAPRGRALQKFLASVIGEHGWSQKEGVRTTHEEMDVIVFRGREYYLLECKWEKSPIEAGVVRELFGKLANRIDVKGIIVSMSGFTGGAVEQVSDYAGQKVILLFGPEDVRSLAGKSREFEELLNEKYDALITGREGIWK